MAAGRWSCGGSPTRQPVRTLAADPEFVSAVAFSPDGALLAAAGSGERFATLWEVASGRLVGRLRHPTYVVAVRFDPQGRTLATAATGGTVRLWDVASRRQLGVALPGPGQSPDREWTVWRSTPAVPTWWPSTATAPAWCGTWTPTAGSSAPARSRAAR